MKKTLAFVTSITVLGAFFTSPANGAVKAGATCTKAGSTLTTAGKKFTCVKSGKKFVWNNGVAVVKPAPAPTPTTSSSTAVDSVNYKGVMIYGVRDSKLIRRADTGIYYETESRKESDLS